MLSCVCHSELIGVPLFFYIRKSESLLNYKERLRPDRNSTDRYTAQTRACEEKGSFSGAAVQDPGRTGQIEMDDIMDTDHRREQP